MRHSIAHAILASLRTIIALLLPATGSRRKCCVQRAATSAPQPVIPESPWSRPWTSPSKEEAAAIFRHEAEHPEALLQRERRRALVYAAAGLEYPYYYRGAPFGAEAFANVMSESG
ncbi:hypothetical protein [Streptomyces acidiscabies]|uniref:Uncharacterized protein n=1 Tax=Streptomyces acidiscabies TaxID=42234 RepID=A0AAP6BCK0_9ACTN|nr:hypothetical protein [Streptomyces acidiscabies]MBP5938466.1 hypothetical protein [Streptomyces sp. LBUM 1476]MBZ3909568.1 hypothetical protein [Streptomyces acidiscabies]MDX2962263.1 hypothetical protein [Streptomyces acidiscabies]MDX3019715.1 hypothetical protein [Streptomyces acidiscabies]MDX3792282.1 hypothetical protein [Streptomyces acidiscabies]